MTGRAGTTGREWVVKVARHVVGRSGDTLITLGLGSCVAIVLHDPVARLGALAHVLLPEPALSRDASNPAKFASTAVPLLLREIGRAGASPCRVEARLVGGAAMFQALMGPGSFNMGERNAIAARSALGAARIPLRGEAIGADYGRSVRFDVERGRVLVSSFGRPDVVL